MGDLTYERWPILRRAPRGALLVVMAAALGAIVPATIVAAETSATPRIDVRNPRPFGYVIGDRLEQQILVEVPSALSLISASVPSAGRATVWLKRQKARIVRQRTGDTSRYDIAIDYQIVNVPEQVQTIEMPELRLRFAGAAQSTEAVVARWPIVVAPITPTYVLSRAGLGEVRPDATPPLIGTRSLRLRWVLWAILLAGIAAYGALDRFGLPYLRRRRAPFARAVSDLRRLARTSTDERTRRRAMQRLHRAFDETAGHAVFAEHLAGFFALHGELAGTRTEAERFFRISREAFFGGSTEAHPDASASLDVVLALARRCRDAERGAL
jgi:mxaA protein